jgi:tetratricopeptide (TPR) repeat protein
MHPKEGRPVPLLPDEVRVSWEEARRTSAGVFAIAAKDAASWHAEAAQRCVKAKRSQAALPHLDYLGAHAPEWLGLFALRGPALAEAGQWQRAADDFEKAAEQSPDRHQVWLRHGLLRLYLKDEGRFGRIRAEMLDRFESAEDVLAAQRAAWLGVLAPAPEKIAARLVTAAERAVKASPTNHAYLLTLGAAQYRAGRDADSVRSLEAAMKVWGKDDTVWDWLFLAMAHHRLGAADQAKTYFDRATQWIDRHPALFWSDRLELTLLRREAEQLLNAK